MKKKKEEEGLDGYDWYEGQPKWPMRRILGVLVLSISIFMYVFLFFRFCTAFSGGFGEVILLTGESAAVYPEKCDSVRRFYPATREDEDGAVQVQYVVALEETDAFQLTLKVKKSAYPPAKEGAGYRVVLRWDKEGETRFVELADFVRQDNFGYRYLRCLFDGVPDAADATLTLLVCPATVTGDPALSDAFYTATVGGSGVTSAVVTPKPDVFSVKE